MHIARSLISSLTGVCFLLANTTELIAFSSFTRVGKTITACTDIAQNIDIITSKLALDNWTVLEPNQFTEQMISSLSWVYMARYFFGNAPSARLKSQLELQIKTINGLLKKKNIRQSQTRFMKRDIYGQEEVLLVSFLKSTAPKTSIQCRFVAAINSVDAIILEVYGQTPSTQWPDFRLLDTPLPSAPNRIQTLNIALLNTKQLAQKTGKPLNIAATFETYSSFQLSKE